MPQPVRDVSQDRKAAFYVGSAMLAVGFLIFFSVFVTHALNFANPSNMPDSFGSFAIRGVLGMGLMIAGSLIRKIGVRGLAGSGVVLDPQQARRDIEPWARMGGGMLKDTLEEAGVDLSRMKTVTPEAADDFESKLRKLHQLHQDGILSDEEYAREKQEILDRI